MIGIIIDLSFFFFFLFLHPYDHYHSGETEQCENFKWCLERKGFCVILTCPRHGMSVSPLTKPYGVITLRDYKQTHQGMNVVIETERVLWHRYETFILDVMIDSMLASSEDFLYLSHSHYQWRFQQRSQRSMNPPPTFEELCLLSLKLGPSPLM